ncbi:MAG: YraN family protein [Treponema sp.]|jgi:putative endonuclease|nr:YraN family protein [Treponema sp.]
MTSRTKGLEGENRAAAVLEQAGLRVMDRNIRWKTGEIDLVALDGETVVFVEVKNWPAGGPEDLEYGIDRKKQRRIIETAKYFLSSHREYSDRPVRFDVVFLNSETVTHLESAFMEIQ